VKWAPDSGVWTHATPGGMTSGVPQEREAVIPPNKEEGAALKAGMSVRSCL